METMTARHIAVQRSRPGLGRGLFAARDMEKGNFIVEYSGRRIASKYADTLSTRYLFELDDEWTIDGSSRANVARYINHSCVPNAEGIVLDGRVLIHAARDIRADEEITIDYGDEYFDEFIKPLGCKCERCAIPIAHR